MCFPCAGPQPQDGPDSRRASGNGVPPAAADRGAAADAGDEGEAAPERAGGAAAARVCTGPLPSRTALAPVTCRQECVLASQEAPAGWRLLLFAAARCRSP